MTKHRPGIAAQLRDFSYAWAESLRAIASMLNDTATRIEVQAWAQEDKDYWLRGPDGSRRP